MKNYKKLALFIPALISLIASNCFSQEGGNDSSPFLTSSPFQAIGVLQSQYPDNREYIEAMEEASAQQYKKFMQQRTDGICITIEDVDTALEELMVVRKKFSGKAGNEYGVRTPRTQQEANTYREAHEQQPVDDDSYFTMEGSLCDFVTRDGKLYGQYFPDLLSLYQQRGNNTPVAFFNINGELILASAVALKQVQLVCTPSGIERHIAVLGIDHPSFLDQAKIRFAAYKKLADAVNAISRLSSVSTEQEEKQYFLYREAYRIGILDEVAEAFRMLCHATPWINGSPTVILAYIHSLLQTMDVRLPTRNCEPFWYAIRQENPMKWQEFTAFFDKELADIGNAEATTSACAITSSTSADGAADADDEA